MIKASDDQELVIERIKRGHHVVTDAVAGAGKTTLILLLAHTFPEKQFIQVTYNSQLKHEVRRKAEQLSLKNIQIHTFHSLAVAFYDGSAHTDIGIRRIIEQNSPAARALPACDIFVIDEAQDMTFLYYKFIKKFLKELGGEPIQQLIVGDTFQGIYAFKGADTRFLSLAHLLWFPSEHSVVKTAMTTSYRITHPIAHFVNEVLIGSERVQAQKDGPRVEYLKWDIWDVHNILVPEILDLIKNRGVKPEEIFILAGSVKSPRSPIKRLENALVLHGIKCYVPMADDKKIDDDVTTGKVIFTTFHQAKGRERRVVIVYGFDASYYDYYARDEPRNKCPSTLYVAATRALDRLYLIEDVHKDPLPFLKSSVQDKSYIKWHTESVNTRKRTTEPPERCLSPTDLVKFLREDILSMVTTQVESLFEEMSPANTELKEVPKKVSCGGTHEEISDITGLTMITMFKRGKNALLEYLNAEKIDKVDHGFLTDAIKRCNKGLQTVSDYLYLCNTYIAVKERLYFRLAQLTEYNWLSEEVVEQTHRFMRKHLREDFEHEQEIGELDDKGRTIFVYTSPEYGRIKFKATIDGYDSSAVWMLKWADDIQVEHELLLVVWAWIWNRSMLDRVGSREFKIMNTRTGQVKRLRWGPLVEAIVQTLLKNMFDKGSLKTDGEFLDWCK